MWNPTFLPEPIFSIKTRAWNKNPFDKNLIHLIGKLADYLVVSILYSGKPSRQLILPNREKFWIRTSAHKQNSNFKVDDSVTNNNIFI